MKNPACIKPIVRDDGHWHTSFRLRAKNGILKETVNVLPEIVRGHPEIVIVLAETVRGLPESIKAYAESVRCLPESVKPLPEIVNALPETFKACPVEDNHQNAMS